MPGIAIIPSINLIIISSNLEKYPATIPITDPKTAANIATDKPAEESAGSKSFGIPAYFFISGIYLPEDGDPEVATVEADATNKFSPGDDSKEDEEADVEFVDVEPEPDDVELRVGVPR